jgi:hypothetical protein
MVLKAPDFFGGSAMTNDELREIRRREFRPIRRELDFNQTDFGACSGARARDNSLALFFLGEGTPQPDFA